MHEVRLHGRGGQGVVTAAEILSVAAFLDGKHAQAFPSFGSERTGAPVAAFCRIGTHAIRLREPVVHPDLVVVLDPTLLHSLDVFAGLKPGAHVLVNTSRTVAELGLTDLTARLGDGRIWTIAASEIARRFIGRPLPNAALLGALAAATGVVWIDSLCAAIAERFVGPVGDQNVAAARAAYALVRPAEELRC
jgi:pyruvate ferredoxin oxidoreductase gamma subunit